MPRCRRRLVVDDPVSVAGVNVRELDEDSALGEFARLFVSSLGAAGVPTSVIPVGGRSSGDASVGLMPHFNDCRLRQKPLRVPGPASAQVLLGLSAMFRQPCRCRPP